MASVYMCRSSGKKKTRPSPARIHPGRGAPLPPPVRARQEPPSPPPRRGEAAAQIPRDNRGRGARGDAARPAQAALPGAQGRG